MNWNRFLALLVFCFGLFSSETIAFAQSGDPSDAFLSAYMSAQQAERSVKEGNLEEARKKLRYAASLLEQLRKSNANWQPLIVDYRLRKIGETLRDVEQKIALQQTTASGVYDVSVPSTSVPAGGTSAGTEFLPDNTLPEVVDLGSADDLPSQPSPPDGAAPSIPRSSGGPAVMVNDAGGQALVLQRRVESLQQTLNQAQSNLETLRAERDTLRQQLDSATGSANADTEEMQKELEKVRSENLSLVERSTTAESSLEAAQLELKAAKETAETETKELTLKLADATQQLEVLGKEKVTLAEERDAALVRLENSEEAASRATLLQSENEQLLVRLQSADQQIAELTKEPDRLKEQLAEARNELIGVRAELQAAREENTRGSEQVASLREELERLSAQLASTQAAVKNPEELQRLQGENDLLRQIVLRQLKEQARRDQARRLVLEELEKVQGKSQVLVDQVSILSEPLIELSEAERNLFRTPQLVLQEADLDAMADALVMGESIELANLGTPPPPTNSEIEEAELPASAETSNTAETEPAPDSVLLSEAVVTVEPGEPIQTLQDDMTMAALEEPPTTISAELSIAKPSDGTTLEGAVAAVETTTTDLAALPTTTGNSLDPLTDPLADPLADPLPEPPASSNQEPQDGPRVQTTLNPRVPEELLPMAREARDFFERGQYRQAELAYQKLLARAPENVYGLSNLGVVLYRSGKLKQSEIALKKAITVSPEDAFSHATLGIVYHDMGKYDDAVEALTKSITLDSKNAQAHNYLGITASQKGWREAAEEEFQKAIALNPDYADAHFNLAVVYATDEPPSRELAKRHYQRAIVLGAEPDPIMDELIN